MSIDLLNTVYYTFSRLQVKALLVNIFGGIVNCAVIANGLIKAFERIKLQIPLIVRLEGIIATSDFALSIIDFRYKCRCCSAIAQ